MIYFLRAVACAAAILALTAPQVPAQPAYPVKPIRVIVPIAAGSITDVIMRAASQELSARLGQPLVIDNRTGASGIIGAEACAKATPDGYTICAIYTAITSVNPYVFDKLPYDPATDFAAITHLYYVTGALVVPAALPVNTVAELRTLVTGKPRAVNFGTIGPGSYPEVFLKWLNNQWKTDLTAVPYKGGAPIVTALLSGEIQASAAGLGNMIGQLQGGQIKALAVSGPKRSRLFPNVPTMAEAGLGGFAGNLWWGLAAPARTPKQVVMRLNAEFVKLFKEPRFAEFLDTQAVEPVLTTPEAFAAFLKADREWTATLIRPAQRPSR
ncbi:MAG TPA: tripartite tricarboxylate transporter substrate-binding protein [Burkholderiales bacterium]|nr:tripartite tricarboxylate transporter substrate-binding protein [Burkholderiales bacterium]